MRVSSVAWFFDNLEDYKEYLAQELFYMYMKDKQKGTLAVYERDNLFNVVFDPKKVSTILAF